MNAKAELLSFQVVPGPKGIAEAEQRLRQAGFVQIKHSPDGQRLLVVASRELIERVLGFSLIEKRRLGRIRGAERPVAGFEFPKGTSLPASLQDAVAEVIFSAAPDYYQPPAQKDMRS